MQVVMMYPKTFSKLRASRLCAERDDWSGMKCNTPFRQHKWSLNPALLMQVELMFYKSFAKFVATSCCVGISHAIASCDG